MRVKMAKQPPPAPTASTVGPCPTISRIRRTPRNWDPAPLHHPTTPLWTLKHARPSYIRNVQTLFNCSCERNHVIVGWLVGCFGFNGPLRQYFSLYRAVSQSEGERGERIGESKNVQTTPTRTYCKRNRPLPYCNQICRTPRHWKVTQHHRTTRPPPPRHRDPREMCIQFLLDSSHPRVTQHLDITDEQTKLLEFRSRELIYGLHLHRVRLLNNE